LQAIAPRYAREGYAVTLVGRHEEPLDFLARELTTVGSTARVWEMPTVDPDQLADLLWTMHYTKAEREVVYR
jgi:short-subunit dehydrogenase